MFLHYLGKINCQIFTCSTTDIGFIFTKLVSFSSQILTFFCRNTPIECLKYILQFGMIPTSEFLYLITNDATDAIKAVVHMVNIKFRKLKRIMSEILTKLDNLSKRIRASARIVLHGHSCRRAVSGSRTKEVLWK